MDKGRPAVTGREDRLLYPTRIYKEQNYKACIGMLLLDKEYTNRLEAACKRAANNVRINYTMIKDILKNGLDKQAILFDNTLIPMHDNIRGAGQYQ